MTDLGERSRPRKILYVEVNEDGSVGGSHQVLYDMVLRLDRSRFEPLVMFYQNNAFVGRLEEEGVRTVVWEDVRRAERAVHEAARARRKLREVPAAIIRRRRFLRSEGIDLVHMNNSPRTGRDDWLPAARLVGIPIVASARGDAKPLPGRGLRPTVHRWLMRRFNQVIPVSEYIAEAMRAQGIPGARITVVHDGVNPDAVRTLGRRSRDQVRRDVGVPEERVFVAVIGNIRPWKGQHVVIEALNVMDPNERGSLFVGFVGAVREEDRPYFEKLEQMVQDFGLSGLVSFVGHRTDVPEILWSSDIAVHCSTTPEPGGTVVIEAMTFGAPVVVANKGGHLDYLEPGLGLIHDVEEPEQLAAHLAYLVRNPSIRVAMAARAKERASGFSIERTAERMATVYDKLLPPPQPRPSR